MSDETEAPPYGGLDLAIPGWAGDWPIPVGMTAYQRDVLALMHSNLKSFSYIIAAYQDVRYHNVSIHWYASDSPHPGDRVSMVADNGYLILGPHSIHDLRHKVASGECVLVDTSALPYRRQEDAERLKVETLGRARPLIEGLTAKQRRARRPAKPQPDAQQSLFDEPKEKP